MDQISVFPLTINIIYKENYSQSIKNPDELIENFGVKDINCWKQGNISNWQSNFKMYRDAIQMRQRWEDYFLPFDLSDYSILNILIGCLQLVFNNDDGSVFTVRGRTINQIDLIIQVLESRHYDINNMLAQILLYPPGTDVNIIFPTNRQILQTNRIKVEMLCNLKYITRNLTIQQFPYYPHNILDSFSNTKKLGIIILMCARWNYRDINCAINNIENSVVLARLDMDRHILQQIILYFMTEQQQTDRIRYIYLERNDIESTAWLSSEESSNLLNHGCFVSDAQRSHNQPNLEDIYIPEQQCQSQLDELDRLMGSDQARSAVLEAEINQIIMQEKLVRRRMKRTQVIIQHEQIIQRIQPAFTVTGTTIYDDIIGDYIILRDQLDLIPPELQDIQQLQKKYNILRQLPFLHDQFIVSSHPEQLENLLIVNRKALLVDFYISSFYNRSIDYFFEHSFHKYNQFQYWSVDAMNYLSETRIQFLYQINAINDIREIYKTQIRVYAPQYLFLHDYLFKVSRFFSQLKNCGQQQWHPRSRKQKQLELIENIIDTQLLVEILSAYHQRMPYNLSTLFQKYFTDIDQHTDIKTPEHLELCDHQNIAQRNLTKSIKTGLDILNHIIVSKQAMCIKKQIDGQNVQTQTSIQSINETIIIHNILSELTLIKQEVDYIFNDVNQKNSQLLILDMYHDNMFDFMFLKSHFGDIYINDDFKNTSVDKDTFYGLVANKLMFSNLQINQFKQNIDATEYPLILDQYNSTPQMIPYDDYLAYEIRTAMNQWQSIPEYDINKKIKYYNNRTQERLLLAPNSVASTLIIKEHDIMLQILTQFHEFLKKLLQLSQTIPLAQSRDTFAQNLLA